MPDLKASTRQVPYSFVATLVVAGAVAQGCASPHAPPPADVAATTTGASPSSAPAVDRADSEAPSSEPAQPEQGGLGISGLTADEKAQLDQAKGKRHPAILPGKVTVKGSVSPDAIRRTFDENRGRFRLCYEARLAKNPTLHGNVVVALAIDPTGAVTNAKDDGSTIDDPELVACVARQFTRLRVPPFPAPSATASVPLVFTPGQ
jgi:hypothetical protein